MRISQGIFAVVCIVFTIQIALVECDQALGTRINAMSLNTIANRDRLLGGASVGGIASSVPSFQIWIKGIVTADYNAVVTAINGAGCNLLSSNIGNAAKGLPHWNYVVARIRCSTDAKWKTLVYNQAFYSRVAFTERSFSIQTDTISIEEDNIAKRIAIWQGKVNQHTASGNTWATDPDGTSGAELDKLTYCRKWWPKTTGIKLVYQAETITGWRDAGNTGGPYTRKVNSTQCIQPSSSSGGSSYKRDAGIDISKAPQISEEEREHHKQVYESMMRSINEYNTTLQFHLDQEHKRAGIVAGRLPYPTCPENPAKRDEMIDSLATEEEKNALRKALTQACDTSSGGYTPPPPYYPPPPPPPPSNCPQPPIEREAMENMQAQIDAAETEQEKQEIIAKYAYPATNCPPTPPPQPPYVPPSIWQCAQVAEGNTAVLTCPPGKVIKKIEYASYGNSPALGSCAEYPRVTRVQYGTCHSSNSEYIVNRQCCGQNSCAVSATNAVFIDPCNGVGKTLRIKAICDVPEKIECSMPLCGTWGEGSTVQLSCPTGMTIKTVNFASYSSVPSTSCYNSFAVSGVCPGNPDLVKNKTLAMCKNKNYCSFTANTATFGGVDPCPGKSKNYGIQALCATHEPYAFGMDQFVSMQPSSNPSWESTNGRPWTNYFEYLEWGPSVDYYNTNFGGTFYLLDTGVYEMHQEFLIPGVTPDTTKIKRLPNVRNPDTTKQYDGFLTLEDRQVKDENEVVIGVLDPWLEDNIAHGTTNAAIVVGNTLGLSRTVQLYHAKVGTEGGGLFTHAFVSAYQNINYLSGSTGHARPSVVLVPFFFNFGMGYCVTSRLTAVPPEPICSDTLIDEMNTAYDLGIIIVLPTGNGYNWWTDLYTNFVTGMDFQFENGTPYPNAQICDSEPMSAVPIDICNSASKMYNTQFNVWDLFIPIYNKTSQKPLIVTANDINGRITRFRTVVYNENDLEWEKPWNSIGAPNVGSTCVDYASFGIQFSKTAANYWAYEDNSHRFPSGYREPPYTISATSFSVATAGAVAMYTYGRYGGQYYSGQNIENMKYYMSQYGKKVTNDNDQCRNNYWQINADTNQYPRLRFIL